MADEPDWQYVGFWKRFIASIVDSIVLLLVLAPLLYAAYGAEYWLSDELIKGPFHLFVNFLLPPLLVIGLWRWIGSTPGKLMFGARIVDATTGEPPSTGQAIGRYFAYFLSTIPLCLGFLWVAFDARKQGWHDKLAHTVVVSRTGSSTAPGEFRPKL